MQNNIIGSEFKRWSIYAHELLFDAVEAAENILPVDAHEEAETIHNMTTENKLYFQAEKEAIFLILTGIGDEIYSTVDACNTAKEMWTAIERLQQVIYYQAPNTPKIGNAHHTCNLSSIRPSADYQTQRQEIANQLTPQWSRFWEDSDPEQARRDKGYEKRTWHSLLSEQGVPLQAEQDDWIEDTVEEIDEQIWKHFSVTCKRFRRSNMKFPVRLGFSAHFCPNGEETVDS
ncbi:hypothetical protein Tco_0596494 [Tanacetum coccineum]